MIYSFVLFVKEIICMRIRTKAIHIQESIRVSGKGDNSHIDVLRKTYMVVLITIISFY